MHTNPFAGGAVIQCFEGNNFVGSYSHYCCGFDSSGDKYSAHWPHVALFCPYCGEIWGRRYYVFEFEYNPYLNTPWVVQTEACTKHGGGQLLPTDLIKVADEQLIQREFALLMKQFSQELA